MSRCHITIIRQNSILTILLLLGLILSRVEAFLFGSKIILNERKSLHPGIHYSSPLDEAPSSSVTTGRVNENVRNIMNILTDRCGDGKDSKEWNKTRNYLYRSSGRVTRRKVEDVLLFLEDTFPGNTFLQRSILQTSPRIFSRSVKTNLRPTAAFLKDLYGETLFEKAVERNSDLLLTTGMGYNDAEELALVEVFLQKELKLKKKEVDQLKRTAPFIFQLSMVKVLSSINYLKELISKTDGYDEKKTMSTINKLILSHPQILQLSVEDNIKPRLKFLMDRCNLDESNVAVLFQSASGGVLGLSIKENLEPKLDLLSELLPSREDLRKVLLSHPQILGLSSKNIRNKIAYFDAIDAAQHNKKESRHERSQTMSLAARVLFRAPAVFSLSLTDNIVPTIEYLALIWGTSTPILEWKGDEFTLREKQSVCNQSFNESATDNSLAQLLSEYPAILTLSLEGNIKPTVNFFNRTGYISLDGEGRPQHTEGGKAPTIIRGRYIAASLFNRLLPRWHFIASRHHPEDTRYVEHNDLKPTIPLHILVSATDTVFCQSYNIEVDEYVQFKTEAIPRLKFSSQFDIWLNTGRPIDV